MSLTIACYIPTAIILSAESRSTSTSTNSIVDESDIEKYIDYTMTYIASDFENKVFLSLNKFGITVCGNGLIENFPIQYHIENFELCSNFKEDVSVFDFSIKLKDYFRKFNPIPFVFFFIGGYENNEQYVYRINVAEDEIFRLNFDEEQSSYKYSISYEGVTEIVERLTTSIPDSLTEFRFFNIQDGVDYSRHLISTTINQMKFENQFPTVGGEIDTLIITRNGAEFISKKKVRIND